MGITKAFFKSTNKASLPVLFPAAKYPFSYCVYNTYKGGGKSFLGFTPPEIFFFFFFELRVMNVRYTNSMKGGEKQIEKLRQRAKTSPCFFFWPPLLFHCFVSLLVIVVILIIHLVISSLRPVINIHSSI